MGMKIKDTRAIVTGGARGLGLQYSRHLLLKGAKATNFKLKINFQ